MNMQIITQSPKDGITSIMPIYKYIKSSIYCTRTLFSSYEILIDK